MPMCPSADLADWTGGTIKCALVSSSWTPNPDMTAYSDFSGDEVTGTGYTAGGVTVGSKTRTYDSVSRRVTFDCADPTWASSTITAKHAVFYEAGGSNPVIGYYTFPSEESSVNGNFIIQVSTNGLFTRRLTEYEG